MLTKGVPNKSGNMQVNKQSTLFYWNILCLHEGHWYSQSRGSVTSYQLTEMFSSWNPDNSPKAHAHFSYIPPSPIAQAIIVMSLDDVMIVCSTFQWEKHCVTCRGNAMICLHICWHPHWMFTTTTTHKPHHLFHIPNFEPVTLSPRYFGAPSLWDLNLFSNMQGRIQGVKDKMMAYWWQNQHWWWWVNTLKMVLKQITADIKMLT